MLRKNCFLEHVIEGRDEDVNIYYWATLKESRGYWNLKEEALDRTVWRTRFGRGHGPVLRQTAQ